MVMLFFFADMNVLREKNLLEMLIVMGAERAWLIQEFSRLGQRGIVAALKLALVIIGFGILLFGLIEPQWLGLTLPNPIPSLSVIGAALVIFVGAAFFLGHLIHHLVFSRYLRNLL
jgi:hypothetical protein